MQTPAKLAMRWFEGATNNCTFKIFEDRARTIPADITGVRWIFEAREGTVDDNFPSVVRKDSAVDGQATVEELNGTFTFNVSPADSAALPRRLFYNVLGIWPDDGPTLCYFEGQITVSQAIVKVS